MTQQTDRYQKEFSASWPDLPGYKTTWVDQMRLKAIDRLSEKGFPAARDEDWKYTAVTSLVDLPFHGVQARAGSIAPEKIQSLLKGVDAALVMVFLNGRLYQVIRSSQDYPGLVAMNLQEAIASRLIPIQDYLTSQPQTATAFETLNTAFMTDGAFLSVEPGVHIDKPVFLLHLVSDSAEECNLTTRNLLVFGEGSRASVVEKFIHLEGDLRYLTNAVTQTIVKSGAEIAYHKLQDESHQSFHLHVHRVTLERNSTFDSHSYSFGGRLARENLFVDIAGENATCKVNGLFMVDGERQVDAYTNLNHKSPNCQSEELYSGILNQQAKGVFRGKIKVYQDAQKTNARLNNTNLLLSDEAESNTMPQLEIYADDVKCSHGSGSGQLDEQQIFYLKSRGIDTETAHNLLVYAFANTVIDRITSDQIRSQFRSIVLSKLPESGRIKELIQ